MASSAPAATMDDPDLSDLKGFFEMVLTSTNTTEVEKQVAMSGFRDCWDRAGVSVADMEMRLVSRRAEGFNESVILTVLARALESASVAPESAYTYGQLVLRFLESRPRTTWMIKMWPKMVGIVSRSNLNRQDGGGSLWETEELTYRMVVFAWKHRKPENECNLSHETDTPEVVHTPEVPEMSYSSNSNSNGDDGWCNGYEKMAEDIAWKLARCNKLEPDEAKAAARYYVRGLLSVGINYRKLIKIYHSEKQDNFKDAMYEALSASTLRDTSSKLRLISLLKWFMAHARKAAMPNGWSAFGKQRR